MWPCADVYNCELTCTTVNFFLIKILFIFRERGREGERGKHQCVVASHVPPIGVLASNSGMCPDWESNRQPYGLQACAQSTELHQPGHNCELCVLTSVLYLWPFFSFNLL